MYEYVPSDKIILFNLKLILVENKAIFRLPLRIQRLHVFFALKRNTEETDSFRRAKIPPGSYDDATTGYTV
jgi:hypothetical protein